MLQYEMYIVPGICEMYIYGPLATENKYKTMYV